jgi:uncharacterized protein YgiM (DUF1202 family)
MKRQFTLFCLVAVVALLMTALVVPAFGQVAGGAQLRFVHAIPGASPVDIYTDGQLSISALAFGTATHYIDVPAGDHQITVTQTGVTTALWQQTVSAPPNSATTLIASSTDPLGFQPFTDDLNPIALGKARLTAVHAIAGGPTVDVILADGRPVIPGLEYNTPYGTLDVPTGVYELAIVPAGAALSDALIPTAAVPLASGTSYMAIAYGTTANPALLVLDAPTTAEGENGLVRFVHGVADAPALDIFVNDALVAPSVEFDDMGTPFIAFPAGEHTLAVRLAGSTTDALSGTLVVEAGQFITAAAIGTPENAVIQRFEHDLSALAPGDVLVSVISALESTTTSEGIVITSGGATVVENPAVGEITSVFTTPSADGLEVNLIGAGDTQQTVPFAEGPLYGGVFYSTIIVENAGEITALALRPYSHTESIASAPGDTEIAVVVATELAGAGVPTTSPQVGAVMATPTATPAAAAQVATAPAAPTVPAPLPTLAPTRPALPVARVLVDPGVNLQLRQFPRSSALSLGLAPSGALLDVQGRAGLESTLVNVTPGPEATPFVDPASVLAPNADLDPATTWLYVSFSTPDGGVIEAWVNALYLAVSDPAGRTQRLASLPTVPADTAGEARDTQVQPPQAAQDVITVTIIGLDAGVNLNIRRTLGTDGEALARVPAGTTLIFEGVNTTNEWVFVRYTSPETGTVRGWVDALYTSFALNGRPVDLAALEQADLLTRVADDTRGGVEAGTTGLLPPGPAGTPVTRDAIIGTVQLDPGANLQLRRRPSVSAESLGLLPAGTQVVVSGRTQEGQWLAVEFEGVQGYVSSQYVSLTQNGRTFTLENVPLITIEGTPLAGTPVPAEQSAGGRPPVTLVPGAPIATPVPGAPLSAPEGAPLPQGTDDPNLDPV